MPEDHEDTLRIQGGRVLFAVSGDGRPSGCLLRAVALTQALGAKLHVLRVLPETHVLDVLMPRVHVVHDAASLERLVEACRATQAWCREIAPLDLFPDDHWQVRMGDFLEEVTDFALELDAGWIVIAPQSAGMGKLVTALAHATALPVLFSLAPIVDGKAIVAATDMRDPRYPLLNQAAKLGRRFERTVIAVHNVAPSTSISATESSEAHKSPLSFARRERLIHATEHMAGNVESVVASEAYSVDAILGEARVRDAGVIMVGTRPHSWLRRALADSVPTQVVDQAHRSVLVTPLLS